MTTKTKVPVIGSIVKYFDMANQNGARMKVVELPQPNQKTPSGYPLPDSDYELFIMEGTQRGQTNSSDLRQRGWTILDEDSGEWLRVDWEG